MRKGTARPGLLLAASLTILLSARSAPALILCRRACAASIADCIATQGFRTECIRQTVSRCRREGPGVCASGTAVVTVLWPPTSLAAAATSTDTIHLTWVDGGLDVGFSVERSVDGATFAAVGTTLRNATAYSDRGLTRATTYYYRVRSLGPRGTASAYSSMVSAMTLGADADAPSTPTDLAASASRCGQVDLAWAVSTDTGSGVMAYNVYRGTSFVKLVPAPATSTADAALAASTVYSYTVSAVDNAGNQSGRSNTATTNTPACPDTTPPSVPTGLSASATSCSQIDVRWAASTDTGGSGLKGYNVYRNGAFVTQVPAPATSTADQGRSPSTGYPYTVAAVDNAGNQSAPSAAVTATTPACALNPVLEGFVPGVGTTRDVVVDAARGLAYVASSEFGLAVVSVANPSAPVVLGAANPPFYGDRVAVSGSLAIVTGNSLGLRVVDVSVPSAPRPVASLSGTMRAAAMAGQLAYALNVVPGNPSHTDLIVIDVHVPAAAAIVGRVTLGIDGAALRVDGALAYVAAGGAGLEVVDVSNPFAPTLIGAVDTPGTATGVAVANGRAYVADDTALEVVDVTSPRSPVVVGSLATRARAVTVVGTRLYVLDGGLQLKVVDITNPAAPAPLSAVSGLGAQSLDAAGSLVFLASPQVDVTTKTAGLYAVDASIPTAPRVVGNSWGGFDSWGVAVAGPLAVAAGNSFGMRVVDVSVPSAPRTVAALGGTIRGVAISGQFAYALNLVPGNPAHTDLLVLDLRSPATPAVVGRTTLAGGSDVKVAGTLVYVYDGGAGLQIVDVGNPL